MSSEASCEAASILQSTILVKRASFSGSVFLCSAKTLQGRPLSRVLAHGPQRSLLNSHSSNKCSGAACEMADKSDFWFSLQLVLCYLLLNIKMSWLHCFILLKLCINSLVMAKNMFCEVTDFDYWPNFTSVHPWVMADICCMYEEIPSRQSCFTKNGNTQKHDASGHNCRQCGGIKITVKTNH